MYIKEITIDGFKSYAQRTTIGPFDAQFNAITGLNGSGKSNILDSICFVMGISNLSNVRATGLSDLVYKNGRAGVTRATVSITFDNRNKSQSPIGYENEQEIVVSRQIVVDGKNKYTINGLNATNQKVVDFFRSVQLNVNNPHFLIMQGRITKVLNMKPPEILSMIEEAAGTRMYESKREVAQKTIEKKEEKLKQITDVLQEEILPKLIGLKKERDSYMQYQEMLREIEHLSKLEVAYQYHQAQQKVVSNSDEVEKQKKEMEKLQDEIAQSSERIQRLTDEAKELESQQAAQRNSDLKELEREWNTARNNEAEAVSAFEHCDKREKDVKKKISQIEKAIKSERESVEKNKDNLKKLLETFENFKKCKNEAEKEVEQAEDLIQAVQSGMYATESGVAVSLHEQLNNAKTEKVQATTEVELLERKLKSVSTDLGSKEQELKNMTVSGGDDEKKSESLQREIKSIQERISKLGYNKERDGELRENVRKFQSDSNALRNKLENLRSRDWRLEFNYRHPGGNFKDEDFKGVLATLIDVKSEEYQLAIEVAAGGKLFNIVVESDQTAELLLRNGQLRNRVTFIPLNKISGRVCSSAVVQRAKSIAGKENVNHALELVSYDKEATKAMEFAFGNSLVCNDLDKAQKVCYDAQVRTPVVTTGGESFNPDGLLRGGSRPNKESVLALAAEFRTIASQLKDVERNLNLCKQDLTHVSCKASEFESLNRSLEAKNMELETVNLRLQLSSTGMLRQQIDNLRSEHQSISTQLEQQRKLLKSSTSRTAELEKMIKNEDQVKQNEIRKSTDMQKQAKAKLQKVISDHDKISANIDEVKSDISSLEDDIKCNEEELKSKNEELLSLANQREEARKVLDEAKEKNSTAKKAYDEKKEILKKANKEIELKYKEIYELTDVCTANKLEVKKMEYKLESIEKSGKEAKRKIEQLKLKYDWVAKDAAHFGQPNTAYDFTRCDMTRTSAHLAKLQRDKDTLGRKVNMRAMSMLDEAEKRFEDLKKKKNTVLKDKLKLERTMTDLDAQKRQALKEAIARVNQDFGVILNTLLDYAFAELKPPSGQTELDGLEIRCRFGTVWKESLTELSGGQRSLVAISLILAMLKFNPAPLYILDEIDSALDLSHTQNIGRLIATKFQSSQFIVVSLKDGLFNNANVLFRTSFVEGVSAVTRQTKR